MSVLDTPRVDTIILDETILNDDPSCQSAQGCDKTAEWSCVMRCCGNSACLCSTCLAMSSKAVEAHYIICASCGHRFGYARYETIVRTVPL
jgi:hypothetical protein